MLVLSRKTNEAIVIAENVTVRILAVRGNRVCLGIEGPPDIPVHREEIQVQRESVTLPQQASSGV